MTDRRADDGFPVVFVMAYLGHCCSVDSHGELILLHYGRKLYKASEAGRLCCPFGLVAGRMVFIFFF